MSDLETQVVLFSDAVSVTIDKGKARIIGLEQNGRSLLAPGQTGYFTLMAGEGSKRDTILDIKNCTFKKHRGTEDMVDLAFVPKRSGKFPFDVEIHYVMHDGEPGFYRHMTCTGR